MTLDDDAALDPATSGGKAALLARARRLGFPVPDGSVVPCGEARSALHEAKLAAPEGGAPAARAYLSTCTLDATLLAELTGTARRIGSRVVVRSSSPLEERAAWSGAFVSYCDIAPDEIGTAVTGIWSSLYSRLVCDLMENTGEDAVAASIAALVQPYLQLIYGGIARLASGVVEVHGTAGSIPALMSGWERGLHTRVDRQGRIETMHSALPARLAQRVASMMFRAGDELGGGEIEWGLEASGHLVLLQIRLTPVANAPSNFSTMNGLTTTAARRLAGATAWSQGALLDELILPWLAAAEHSPLAADPLGDGSYSDVADAVRLADCLTASAWSSTAATSRERATRVLNDVVHGDRTALHELDGLQPVPTSAGRRVVGIVLAVGARLAMLGRIPTPNSVWQVPRDRLLKSVSKESVEKLHLEPGRAWEPFAFSVAWSLGRRLQGEGAAPGRRAGGIQRVNLPPGNVRSGCVIHADTPHPILAPLLWSAVALLTDGGNPAAHLVGVARSLNVPAITALGLGSLEAHGVVAVDGDSGQIGLLRLHDVPRL